MKLKKILFVTDGVRDNVNALEYLLSVCKVDATNITLLAVMPALPKSLLGYSDKIKDDNLSGLKEELAEASKGIECTNIKVDYEFMTADNAVRAILKKLENSNYDCLIKVAEDKLGKHKGFEALDMTLIRKAICPIWILKGKYKVNERAIKLAVGIDAKLETDESYTLAVRLLRYTDSLAKRFSVPLEIISCWQSAVELAKNEPFVNLSKQDIENDRKSTQEYQLKTLTKLIAKSGIESEHIISQLNGDPDKKIPEYTSQTQISLLVMGSLSRTGIFGALIGNTAENVLSVLDCSTVIWPAKYFN